jgi:PAS domain S-box-containing protein
MDKMHSLLKRQIKKIFGSAEKIPKDFQEIFGAINEAYFNFDADRLLLERSIEISSHELVEANTQMRSIFQALPDMFLRIDANGKILECRIPANNTFSHIKPNELIGKSIYTCFGPLAARRLEWAVRRAVKNKTVELAEYSVQNQTEQFREARVVWLGDEQLIVIVRDITERKLAEDSLLESRRTLQTLMTNLPGMAYRCRNDHDRTMEFASDGSVNLTGYQPAELINKSKITYNQLIHPDESEKVWNTIQDALKEHRPFQITYRIKTADGEQKWVLEQGQGIFTPKGELTAIEGFISDTTESRLAGESLHESEEKYKAVIEATDTGFAALDEKGMVLNANLNYAHLTGHSSVDEILGRNVTEWTAPYDIERNRIEVGKCFQKGSIRNLEIDYQHKDGTIIPVEINSNVVQTKNGKIIVSLCRDITERKAAENQVTALLTKATGM